MPAVFTIAVFSLPAWATSLWHEGEVITREAREREARAAARAAKRLGEYRKEDQTQSGRPAVQAEAQSRREARAWAQERQTGRQEMQSQLQSLTAAAMESGIITLVVFVILVCVTGAVLLRKASARRRVPQTPPPRAKPARRKTPQATPASSATPARRKNPVRRKEPPVAPVSTDEAPQHRERPRAQPVDLARGPVPIPPARQHWAQAAPPRPIIAGKAYVIDGDTIKVSGRTIRLSGLDAPEVDQVAKHEHGYWFKQGSRVKSELFRKIGGKHVRVLVEGTDKYGRVLGTVLYEDRDVGEWLVRKGYAIAAYGEQYKHVEAEARRARRGMWGHAEVYDPRAWRHR